MKIDIRNMTTRSSAPLAVILLFIAMFLTSACSENKTGVTGKEVQYLFVQTAHQVSFRGDTMTLHGVSPTTLFFSDRPERSVGHGTTEEYVLDWASGEDSFADDPPNATLSILDSEEIEDIVITIQNPVLSEGNLTYTVKILDGTPPATGGPNALFIDTIGRPLTPTSVAGAARRSSRRAVRRDLY